jgi:hypothetical protein
MFGCADSVNTRESSEPPSSGVSLWRAYQRRCFNDNVEGNIDDGEDCHDTADGAVFGPCGPRGGD